MGNPGCMGLQSKAERKKHVAPVMMFGRERTDTLPFYGISGFVASKKSFKNFQILATEFNTGEALVAKRNYCTYKQRGYNVRILDENDNVLVGFNELNRPVLGLGPEDMLVVMDVYFCILMEVLVCLWNVLDIFIVLRKSLLLSGLKMINASVNSIPRFS